MRVWTGVGRLTFARAVALADELGPPNPVSRPVPNPKVGRAIHSRVHARKGQRNGLSPLDLDHLWAHEAAARVGGPRGALGDADILPMEGFRHARPVALRHWHLLCQQRLAPLLH